MNQNIPDHVTVIPAKLETDTSTVNGPMKRVAAYCRVSTDEDNQQSSYTTQVSYYTDLINHRVDWQLAGIFADEGISGTRTKNRTQFNNMIRLARRRKIDLILCKSISRFARNTVDCLDYIRELKALGVTVIFEKENINTAEITSEFAISLYASFAQAESESISKNVTWGIEKSFREGNVRYQLRNTLGYRLGEDGKPVIIEEEAAAVRYIFQQFAAGYGVSDIARDLTQKGIARRNGQTVWNRNNVYQILKNEKYAGDAVLQKTYTVNCLTHERAKNTGQRPMVFVQGCHEAIVDRQTYDRVRLELEKRRRNAKRNLPEKGTYQTKYCLSRLLFCPYCGGTYKRVKWLKEKEKIGVWRCRNRLEGRCCSLAPSYHEDRLHRAILAAIAELKQTADAVPDHRYTFDTEAEESRLDKQIGDLLSRITEIEDKRDALLADVNGCVFEVMSQSLRDMNRQESEAADALEELRRQKDDLQRQKVKSEVAIKLFNDIDPPDTFDDVLIEKLLLRVEAINKKEVSVIFHGGYHVTVPVKKC